MGTYRSLDQGETWTTTLPNATARSFAAGNGLLAIGAFRGGLVYISQDRGEQWTDVSGNLPGGMGVWAMAFDDQFLYAAVARQGLWRISLSELKSLGKKQATDTASTPAAAGLSQGPPGRPGNMLRQNLLSFDSNGDGKLTREEIPLRMQRILSQADANKDDALDSEEIAKFLQQIRPGRPN